MAHFDIDEHLGILDRETIAMMLEAFIETSRDDLARLKMLCARGEHQDAASHAHSLKGSAMAVGAMPLANVVAAIETELRQGRLPAIDPIDEELAATLQAIENWRQGNSQSDAEFQDRMAE